MNNRQSKWSIVRQHHEHGVPVMMRPIAKDLGLKVYYTQEWSDDISGMIAKDKKSESGYSIYINGNHHTHRRRFTIAHEIAHYILHENMIGDGISDDVLYRSKLSNQIEYQANEMAADILMPWDLIDSAMNNGHNSLEELAAIFQVSKSAMSIRLGVPYETKD